MQDHLKQALHCSAVINAHVVLDLLGADCHLRPSHRTFPIVPKPQTIVCLAYILKNKPV